MLLARLGTQRDQGPQEAAEILNRKGQRERAWDDIEGPERRHYERNQRPIQKGSEHEALGVQPAAHYVEHAQAAHQNGDQAEEIRPLFGEWRHVQR